MNVTATELPGVLIIEPKVFGDERGFFYESYNARNFAQATGQHVDLSRTTTRVRKKASCAVCTTRSNTLRENWCVSQRVKSWT